MRRLDARSLLLLLGAVTAGASAFPAIRAAVAAYAPGELALLRWGVASILLAGYAWWARIPRLRGKDLAHAALIGLIGMTLYHLALNLGETGATAGTASLLVSTSPLLTALLAFVALRERASVAAWIGLVVSFLGASVLALSTEGGLHVDRFAAFLAAAALAQASYVVVMRALVLRHGALVVTCHAVWFGALFLAPFALTLPHAIAAAPASATLAAVYTGIVPGALGAFLWAAATKRTDAGTMGSFLFLVPPLVMTMEWLWMGVVPTTRTILGGALVLAGLGLATLSRRHPRAGRAGTAAPTLPSTQGLRPQN